MSKTKRSTVIAGPPVTRDQLATITDHGRYAGDRRARLSLGGGKLDLGMFAQLQYSSASAILTFRGELEEPFEGTAEVLYGHPTEPILFAVAPIKLAAGLVEVELHLAVV